MCNHPDSQLQNFSIHLPKTPLLRCRKLGTFHCFRKAWKHVANSPTPIGWQWLVQRVRSIHPFFTKFSKHEIFESMLKTHKSQVVMVPPVQIVMIISHCFHQTLGPALKPSQADFLFKKNWGQFTGFSTGFHPMGAQPGCLKKKWIYVNLKSEVPGFQVIPFGNPSFSGSSC